MTQPRIYSLDSSLTEEQVAVTFAMTSRSPRPFDQIATEVSETKAADFHEKWVLGYGHASVAEHAILHLAFEGISRIAADALEENRLASYTEKSSRYQLIGAKDYHVPNELIENDQLRTHYVRTMDELFRIYTDSAAYLLDTESRAGATTIAGGTPDGSPTAPPKQVVRRAVMDQVRAVLPAATLTNVGMTANARTMAHAISKLLSDPLSECRALGASMKEAAQEQVPTLLKYADQNDALQHQRMRRQEWSWFGAPSSVALYDWMSEDVAIDNIAVSLGASRTIESIRRAAGERRTEYDPHPRALEVVNYLFRIKMDYGALREFRRHRMMSPMPLWLEPHQFTVSEMFERHGLVDEFHRAMGLSLRLWKALYEECGLAVAQYAVTHAHQQNVVVSMNLREFAEIVRLRTSDRAHASIRKPVQAMVDAVREVHPRLITLILDSEEP